MGKCEVHYSFQLKEVEVTNRSQEKNAIQISAPQKSFIVCAEDAKEKEEWLQEFGKSIQAVTGDKKGTKEFAPLWKPDTDAHHCTLCQKEFTLLNRRHHCRACGTVCCGTCSLNKLIIKHIKATVPVRVCDHCHRAGSISSSSETSVIGGENQPTSPESSSSPPSSSPFPTSSSFGQSASSSYLTPTG
eukprot:TRINITY_DN11926_c0_g1_i1.p1 TRINITY_DN11926_c0_g1~~TRINITY_DN11926_c0_g1_i1.p1  ORF type:complete len:218 (-),score=8.73 TRINITY_DN11926_c0_g1_i1:78-641(-)